MVLKDHKSMQTPEATLRHTTLKGTPLISVGQLI